MERCSLTQELFEAGQVGPDQMIVSQRGQSPPHGFRQITIPGHIYYTVFFQNAITCQRAWEAKGSHWASLLSLGEGSDRRLRLLLWNPPSIKTLVKRFTYGVDRFRCDASFVAESGGSVGAASEDQVLSLAFNNQSPKSIASQLKAGPSALQKPRITALRFVRAVLGRFGVLMNELRPSDLDWRGFSGGALDGRDPQLFIAFVPAAAVRFDSAPRT